MYIYCTISFNLFFVLYIDTNILVQQNCSCDSPLRCKCSNNDAVRFILTDMDLLCLDGKSLPNNYVEWSEIKLHEPAGTYGQKASEVCCLYTPCDNVF